MKWKLKRSVSPWERFPFSSPAVISYVWCGLFHLKETLAPLLLSLMTMVWLKNNAGEKNGAALSCDLKIGNPTPLNVEDLEA